MGKLSCCLLIYYYLYFVLLYITVVHYYNSVVLYYKVKLFALIHLENSVINSPREIYSIADSRI